MTSDRPVVIVTEESNQTEQSLGLHALEYKHRFIHRY